MNLLAIEIGGTKLQLIAGDEQGAVLDRVRASVDREAGGEGIRARIAGTLPALVEKWRPAAIGVGYGGPVDWRTGRIAKSYHVAGWSGFPLGEWLAEKSGVPAFVENDSNAAAFGEATFGAGRGCSPVLYSNSGSGVGGGLVVEGRLYHGAPPGEVEIGHLRLERDGTIVEDRCAGWALDRSVRAEIESSPAGTLAHLAGSAPPGGEARHLAAALAQDDAAAAHILDEAAREYAFALSHATHLFHPEIIVLGGGVAQLGAPWRDAVARHLPGFLMDAFASGPRVETAALGEDAVPVGALALAAARIASSKR